ncbi:MAG: anaerobic ribonucleoside-triphosphate reductase activating protein [Paludibacteraceae bacterium]|nr:anaerobic ribonucleoside-triphosphate reductase activating protein [Paludibacteraceae bacterium]
MNYHKIEKTSIANGEGIRVVLWVSGCSLHCRGCQNPKTWDLNSGRLFDKEAKKELFEALDKPYIQGITFSGGHPLEPENVEEVINLAKEIKEKFPTKDIWLYTGYSWEEIYYKQISRVLLYIDVLVDGKYIDEQRDLTLKWCGSRNQRVINVKESLKENKIVLYN